MPQHLSTNFPCTTNIQYIKQQFVYLHLCQTNGRLFKVAAIPSMHVSVNIIELLLVSQGCMDEID